MFSFRSLRTDCNEWPGEKFSLICQTSISSFYRSFLSFFDCDYPFKCRTRCACFLTEILGWCCMEILVSIYNYPIFVYSDGQTALNIRRFSSALVLECRDTLHTLSSHPFLYSVPRHCGISGTEVSFRLQNSGQINLPPTTVIYSKHTKFLLSLWV